MTNSTELIKHIEQIVREGAKEARLDAALGGSMGDGGASDSESRLKYWLDGVAFATTGKTTVYNHIAREYNQSQDPEYALFLRLKEKFSDDGR